jgi:hypothetical protein
MNKMSATSQSKFTSLNPWQRSERRRSTFFGYFSIKDAIVATSAGVATSGWLSKSAV